jgi:hypothetical protein
MNTRAIQSNACLQALPGRAPIPVALICIIAGSNLFVLTHLCDTTLQNTGENLARYSLTLAENADRSFKSVDLVLSSVAEYLVRRGTRTRRAMIT